MKVAATLVLVLLACDALTAQAKQPSKHFHPRPVVHNKAGVKHIKHPAAHKHHLAPHQPKVSGEEEDLEMLSGKQAGGSLVGAALGGLAGGLTSLYGPESAKEAGTLLTVGGGAAIGSSIGYVLSPVPKTGNESNSNDKEETEDMQNDKDTSAQTPNTSNNDAEDSDMEPNAPVRTEAEKPNVVTKSSMAEVLQTAREADQRDEARRAAMFNPHPERVVTSSKRKRTPKVVEQPVDNDPNDANDAGDFVDEVSDNANNNANVEDSAAEAVGSGSDNNGDFKITKSYGDDRYDINPQYSESDEGFEGDDFDSGAESRDAKHAKVPLKDPSPAEFKPSKMTKASKAQAAVEPMDDVDPNDNDNDNEPVEDAQNVDEDRDMPTSSSPKDVDDQNDNDNDEVEAVGVSAIGSSAKVGSSKPIPTVSDENVARLYGKCASNVREYVAFCPTIDQTSSNMRAVNVFADLQSEALKTATRAFKMINAREPMLFSGLGTDSSVANKIVRRATTRAKASLAFYCHRDNPEHECTSTGKTESSLPNDMGLDGSCPLQLATGKLGVESGLVGRYIQLVESLSEVEDETLFHGDSRFMGAAVAVCMRVAAAGDTHLVPGFSLDDLNAVEAVIDLYQDTIEQAPKHRAQMEAFYNSFVDNGGDLEELTLGSAVVVVYDEVLDDGHSRTRATPGYKMRVSFNWAGTFYTAPTDTSLAALYAAQEDQERIIQGMSLAFQDVAFRGRGVTDPAFTISRNQMADSAEYRYMFSGIFYSPTMTPAKAFNFLKNFKFFLAEALQERLYPDDSRTEFQGSARYTNDLLKIDWGSLLALDVERIEFTTKILTYDSTTDKAPALQQLLPFAAELMEYMSTHEVDMDMAYDSPGMDKLQLYSQTYRGHHMELDNFIAQSLATDTIKYGATLYAILRKEIAGENFFSYFQMEGMQQDLWEILDSETTLTTKQSQTLKEAAEVIFQSYTDVNLPRPININFVNRESWGFLVYGAAAPEEYMASEKRNLYLGLPTLTTHNLPLGTKMGDDDDLGDTAAAKIDLERYCTSFGVPEAGSDDSYTPTFISWRELFKRTYVDTKKEIYKLINSRLGINHNVQLIIGERATL